MPNTFIIMQIGNNELDAVCEHCIVPAIEANGMVAKRVDKHNQGGLLKSEIVKFIETADIIVADLTNERPNCYLEIGYAMGLDKFRNLILTAREDHYPESPNYQRGGPKIHFDLAGYDILFWDLNDLDGFREELERRIRRRQTVVNPDNIQAPPTFDPEWAKANRDSAQEHWQDNENRGHFEAQVSLAPPKISRTQTELVEAARTSEIRTFGWPIGVYLGNRDEYRPRPVPDGIVAVIGNTERDTFDYWTWRRNGDFYILKSLFEDQREPMKLFFDTSIVRMTELLLYCARMYTKLGVDPAHEISFQTTYGGLSGRTIDAAGSRRLIRPYQPCAANEITAKTSTTLEKIEVDLTSLVKALLEPVFVLFDFFSIDDHLYEEIVNDFVNGRV